MIAIHHVRPIKILTPVSNIGTRILLTSFAAHPVHPPTPATPVIPATPAPPLVHSGPGPGRVLICAFGTTPM